MALPDTNISTTLVGQTLGSGSRDVGTLCTHANINKWSKWKPIRKSKISGLILQDLIDEKFGLDVSIYTSLGSITTENTFLYDLKNGNYAWNHLKPTGGVLSPYRLGDFRNYKHDAVCPIQSLSYYNVYLDTNNNIQIDADVVVGYPDNYNITLRDFEHNGVTFNDYYLGLLLYKSNNTYVIATSSTKLSSSNHSIILSDMSGYTGTWSGAFFLSSVPISVGGSVSSGYFLPVDIPHVSITINEQVAYYTVSPEGIWNSTNNVVSYTLTLTNNNNVSFTFTNVVTRLITTTGTQLPENGTVVSTNTHGNKTVTGNGTDTITGTFNHSRDNTKTYWIESKANETTSIYMQVEDYDGI